MTCCKNAAGFFLAGICRPQGEFSILTRASAECIAFIHHRMSVILPQSLAADWLDPRREGRELQESAIQDMQYTLCP